MDFHVSFLPAVDPTIPEDTVRDLAVSSTERINFGLTELRRLFLIDDLVDSAKFGLSLWFLTYLGSWFNAMTLVIVSWVGLFTLPKVTCPTANAPTQVVIKKLPSRST